MDPSGVAAAKTWKGLLEDVIIITNLANFILTLLSNLNCLPKSSQWLFGSSISCTTLTNNALIIDYENLNVVLAKPQPNIY